METRNIGRCISYQDHVILHCHVSFRGGILSFETETFAPMICNTHTDTSLRWSFGTYGKVSNMKHGGLHGFFVWRDIYVVVVFFVWLIWWDFCWTFVGWVIWVFPHVWRDRWALFGISGDNMPRERHCAKTELAYQTNTRNVSKESQHGQHLFEHTLQILMRKPSHCSISPMIFWDGVTSTKWYIDLKKKAEREVPYQHR